jgi:hypothetical protein
MCGLGGKTGASVLGAWLCCLGQAGLARAEQSAPPGSPLGYQRVDVYLEGTLAKSGLEAVNRSLRQAGYSPLGQRALLLGAGFGATLGNVRLTFGAELEPWERETPGGSEPARIGEARAGVMGGPELRFGELFLAPLLGCSIGAATLGFAPGRAPFLAKPLGPTGSSLTRDVITLDLALTADYAFARSVWSARTERQNTHAPVVGLRFGYRWQAWANDWYRGSRRFYGGPELDLGGVFVRIVLGWELESRPRPVTF